MQTLWEIADAGTILIEDVILENSRKKINSYTEFDCMKSSAGESNVMYSCITCQEAASICTFCSDCICHHKNHKIYEIHKKQQSKTEENQTCRCCDSNHQCQTINFGEKINIIDTPDPETGETALYIAAKKNNQSFITKLLNMNCNINALNTVRRIILKKKEKQKKRVIHFIFISS